MGFVVHRAGFLDRGRNAHDAVAARLSHDVGRLLAAWRLLSTTQLLAMIVDMIASAQPQRKP